MTRTQRIRRALTAAIVAATIGGMAVVGCQNNPGGPHNTWNVVHPLNLR